MKARIARRIAGVVIWSDMVSNSLKTVYVCLHDGQKFGETPILKMEILKQDYVSHKQLMDFRHRLERFIDIEFEQMKHKLEYSGAWPN